MTDDEQAELDKVIALLHAAIPKLERMRASHDRLIAAAKGILGAPEGFFYQQAIAELRSAIAAAEELTQ